jgi:hypothetical protein
VAACRTGAAIRPYARIGVLAPIHAEEPESKARISTFVLGLRELGWVDGSNVQIVYRWSGGNVADTRRYAAELAALTPDVILTFGAWVQARCSRQHEQCHLYLRWFPIRLVPALSKVCRDRAATPPAL